MITNNQAVNLKNPINQYEIVSFIFILLNLYSSSHVLKLRSVFISNIFLEIKVISTSYFSSNHCELSHNCSVFAW